MTYLLIALTAIISILAFNNREIFEKLQLNPYSVYHKKEFHRLLSHGFLHADWIHLFVNMFVLYSFGQSVERIFEYLAAEGIIQSPVLAFVILYFSSMIFACITSIYKHKDNYWYNSVGASGAVSAVVFTHIFFFPLESIELYAVIPIPGILLGVGYLIYSHYMSKRGKDNVNHDAHFIGAVFGFLFPIILEPKLFNVFLNQILNIF